MSGGGGDVPRLPLPTHVATSATKEALRKAQESGRRYTEHIIQDGAGPAPSDPAEPAPAAAAVPVGDDTAAAAEPAVRYGEPLCVCVWWSR
jgi:hypothetical protein